jgi:hypothetical protein
MDLFRDIITQGILNNKKEVFDDPEAERVYNPFIVLRALSYYQDTLFYANHLNQFSNLDKDCQISFLLNTVKPTKRPWTKWGKPIKESDVEAVKTYYGYSDARAIEAMKILTEDQLAIIKERTSTDE